MRLLALVCVVWFVGCDDPDSFEILDADVDSSVEDAGNDGGGEVSPEDAVALELVVRGLAASAALAGPLVDEGEMLRDDSRLDMPGMREDTARERVESGVSGNSIVTDETCVTYDWSGLMVTITFASCMMEATGEPLEGALTLAVGLFPTRFTMTFTDLQVGTLGLDGEVGLLLGGRCREGDDGCAGCPDSDPECTSMRENQQTLTADLTLESGASASLVIEDMQVVHGTTGTELDGTAEVTSTMSSGTLTATDVHWNPMECLPSSGSVTYGPTTIELQATTPTTGNVLVTVPPFPTVETMLFEPCSS